MLSLLTSIFLILGLADGPRVISLAPSLTQIVRELGVEPIGVSDFCEADKDTPRLGGLSNPNIEAIVKLKPDYVFLLGQYGGLSEKLAGFHIPVLTFSNDTVAEISDSIRQIALVLGKKGRAKELLDRLNDNQYHLEQKKRVFLVVSGDYQSMRSLIAAGSKSIYGELLEKIGAENIYQGQLSYPAISLEGILQSKPDRVIFFLEDKQNLNQQDLEKRIPSIKTAIIKDTSLLVPGINISNISKAMFEVLND